MMYVSIEDLPDQVSNAFHGTELQTAKTIEEKGFQISKGTHKFLGDGVYFYVGSMDDALFFARRRRNCSFPTVLRATVRLGICLDLFVKSHRKALVRVAKELRNLGRESIPLGQAINFLATNIQPIETIQGVEVNRESLSIAEEFSDSPMWVYSKRMLCVRKTGNILDQAIVYVHGQN